jgi:hypothetical protein
MKNITQWIVPMAVGVAIGIASTFWLVEWQPIKFEEVCVVTYDGCQYHSEAYAAANAHLRHWLAGEAGNDLRDNVIGVAVYPNTGGGQVVGCTLRRANIEHLEQLSREAKGFLHRYPRRELRRTPKEANKSMESDD